MLRYILCLQISLNQSYLCYPILIESWVYKIDPIKISGKNTSKSISQTLIAGEFCLTQGKKNEMIWCVT